MDKQFKLYSVDTKAFYTDEEIELNKSKFEIKNSMNKYEEWQEYKIMHNNYDISFEDYHKKLNRFKELKKIEIKHPTEETEFNELNQFFKKPTKEQVLGLMSGKSPEEVFSNKSSEEDEEIGL